MIPNMQAALRGFEDTMQFQLISKAVVDGQIQESSKAPVVLWFEGCVLPMQPRALLLKPEGERSWRWWSLYTDLQLNVDDVIKDNNGAQYRVMEIKDWSDAGYFEYGLREGPAL